MIPRTNLQLPIASRGNMNSHTSHRTSGFGAGRYPADSFDEPHT
jgi:hypothetical protein